MTALLLHKLRLLIESETAPDAKTLRDCVAVLKELTALTKEFAPPEDETGTGVIILPEVQEQTGGASPAPTASERACSAPPP